MKKAAHARFLSLPRGGHFDNSRIHLSSNGLLASMTFLVMPGKTMKGDHYRDEKLRIRQKPIRSSPLMESLMLFRIVSLSNVRTTSGAENSNASRASAGVRFARVNISMAAHT